MLKSLREVAAAPRESRLYLGEPERSCPVRISIDEVKEAGARRPSRGCQSGSPAVSLVARRWKSRRFGVVLITFLLFFEGARHDDCDFVVVGLLLRALK